MNIKLKLVFSWILISVSSLVLAVDTDFDGMSDDWELANGRDPLVADYQLPTGTGDHICAIDDSGVVCWGDSREGRLNVPNLSNPSQVTTTSSHSCALDDSGVICWGDAYKGGTNVPALSNPTYVSGGSRFSCALEDAGVVCWGNNSVGQIDVPELSNPTRLSSGAMHSCVIDDSGVVCWGNNNAGQIDVPELSNPTALALGFFNTCAIDDSGVVCWGEIFAPAPALNNPTQISSGYSHQCAIDDSGLVCWGRRDQEGFDHGQEVVPALSNPVQVTASGGHTCALDDFGVVCWGNNSVGQIDVPDLMIDHDGDGYSIQGGKDAFPLDSSEWLDTDQDGIGNNADTDDDNDGVLDTFDSFPLDSAETEDADADGIGDNTDTDDDNDGILDGEDSMPFDTDNDGLNNSTDTDDDNDGILDVNDEYPLDTDNDTLTNNLDLDDDNDGVADTDDAFPLDNGAWLDTDGDGLADYFLPSAAVSFTEINSFTTTVTEFAGPIEVFSLEAGQIAVIAFVLDDYPAECSVVLDGITQNCSAIEVTVVGEHSLQLLDSYGDGGSSAQISIQQGVFQSQTAAGTFLDNDDDNDGVLDVDDFFPLNKLEQFDSDGDGVGDNADFLPGDSRESSDLDNDGIGDNSDNCVNMMNTFQEDLDQDGLGDACDDVFSPDPDGDGYTYNDLFPFDASEALDFDGDGVGDNSDEDWLYPENGKNGSSVNFQLYDFVPVNLGANAIYTSTGKLNADSKDDLLIVCGNGCGQIISFTSNANETWNLNLVSETLDVPTSAFIADIDGDSDSDILATNYRDNGGVYYFESVAGAIDSDPVIINSDFYGAKSVKAYDFDKDGDQDLVYASSWHNEVVFEKQLSSSTTKITLSTEVWGVNNLILIDYNRDSWMDIMAVAENSGELIYFENSKNGQFKSKETIFEEEGYLRDATITDYDADGDLDIFAATSGSFGRAGLMLYKRVAGSLERQIIDNTSMFFNYPIEAFPKKIISSDFDNDGDLDLFVEFSNSNAAFYEKSSSGVFSDPKLVFGSTYNQSVIGSYELSDYDNDGDDDLWWVSSPFGIMIFENTCSDIDGDGICDVRDNDQDGDSLSNEEELLLGLDPRNNDSDRDGVDDALDDFPLNLLETTDTDGDGVGDNADLFPNNINEFQDFDLDGIGNNTDDDDDNDGIADVDDAFPFNPGEWSDTDLDGIGDRRDLDDDGDGVNDIDDLFPLDLTEAYDSDGDGFGDNGDAFPDDPNESLDTDADGIGNNSDLDDDNDGFSDEQELIDGTDPLSKFSCREGCASLDLDGSEKYDALTDGLLLLRGMFGLDGSALVAGAIGSDATYTSAVDITARINALGSAADIDGNGQIDALTDGLLTLRYLFGLDDDTLINGVVADDATRKTAEEIEAHLETLMPAL